MLAGKVALITGGTRGIGRATAELFVSMGARVAIVGRDLEAGRSVEGVHFIHADLTLPSAGKKVVEEVLEVFGQLDILVNNAGITKDNLLLRISEEDWDEVLSVNLKSCYKLCQAAARPMMKARSGKIINMSSVVGLVGNAGQTNYAASKAAIIGFSKSLARELALRNIQVNCIAPGFVQTQMTENLQESQKEEFLKMIPLKRFGKPEDVAKVALFLASSLSDYVTAEVVTVSGGF